MERIEHIWFDFSDTIVKFDKEIHDRMVYQSYASITGKPITPALKEEFSVLFNEHKSFSKTFIHLGMDADYWSKQIHSVDPKTLMTLTDKDAPEVFRQLKDKLSISIWSNIHTKKILSEFGIDSSWFKNILKRDEVKKPKPALDGFNLLIERSNIEPENILFVGDSVEKEIRPAHSLGIQTGIIWSSSPEADYCFNGFKEILELAQ